MSYLKLINVVAALGLSLSLAACNDTSTHLSFKEPTERFFQALNARDSSTLETLVVKEYIQHNPFIPDGRDALIALLPTLALNGTTVENIRVIEDGNFVVIHNFWRNAQPFGANEVVSFDVLRFDEKGKIAEHWDALMPNTLPNLSGRTLTDGSTAIIDWDKTEANKKQAAVIFDTIINGTPEEVGATVLANFHPDYLQHSPTVADGVQAIFQAFETEQWVYKTNHKIIGEGNFVLSISEGTAKGVPVAFYDLLRFEGGKVAEHWDVIQTIPSKNLANSNGMFGGF